MRVRHVKHALIDRMAGAALVYQCNVTEQVNKPDNTLQTNSHSQTQRDVYFWHIRWIWLEWTNSPRPSVGAQLLLSVVCIIFIF